ncbi:hypothetical protein BJ166DRAFT_482101 [Pestalotiopsis sp. NC0098]|nr:hypothetical protein BJ166DRAFT_482101 [Pestalotiopsis sp. NC0098]
MVYYFTSSVVSPSAFVYVGKDKFENEDLIKYGWEEDVCLLFSSSPQFHADKLSSAHIYLRMPNPDDSWEAIPEALVTDLAQLTKANSIEGNKKDNVTIIYTPWSNLKKDGSMAVGQVSFKDPRKVRRVLVPTRENAIVNRLNKTKVEKHPDFMQEREDMLKQRRRKDMAAVQARVGKPFALTHTCQQTHPMLISLQKKEEARVAKERADMKYQKEHAYDDLFSADNVAGSSNQDIGSDWEDDFM